MSWWGQSPFDELVEKATSELLPGGQEDLVLNLEISDQIRSKKFNAKDAMRSFKRRLEHKNPNVQLATLNLVDTCVKNGGDVFVKEIASREFMDELVSMLKAPTGCNIDVRNRLLNVIQTWGLASKNQPTLSYMSDTYALLKAEGVQFPPVTENIDGILFEAAAAPEWSDSDVCDRCRTAFTITNRKHHCRNCGGTFCQQCSAKTMALPKLGINVPVRVCDGCYIKLKLDKASIRPTTSTKTTTPQPSTTAHADNRENAYDDDMKKAIELSLKEAEQQKTSYSAGYVASPAQQYQAPSVQQQQKIQDPVEEDPDLAAAIAASLRDLEISKQQSPSQQQQQQQNKHDLSPVEMENILLFSTLMDRVYATGGDVSNDTQINQLYTQIGALQPKLIKNLDETIRKRNAFIEMHEKLNTVVKAYDRLLEARIASVSYNTLPEQHYQQQPLHHQPVDYYPPQSAPPPQNYYPQDYNNYQAPAPSTVNNHQNNYSAPPHYQISPSQLNGAHLATEQKQPVDEAPLIDL
ncbi:hypothetical protein BD408DRAFT_421487 [Parasitella parasitica]|nr:hypothetical protein BD408DRAFT_421487 [Parasitella parasitica]